MHIVDLVNRRQVRLGRPLGEGERFDELSAAVAELSRGNKLNLLVFDGEVMYAHTNFRGTLHYLMDGDSVAISTRPLTDGDWRPLPFMRLMSFRDGRFLMEGQPHGNEYIYNPVDYQMAYMEYSRL